MKVVSGIILTLLLTGVLVLASGVQPVRASPSTIVVPDDYPTIQEAINHATEGDTVYVKAGTYFEHVVMNKTLTLSGENKSTTIIDGTGIGTVVYVNASNARIENFAIRNSGLATYDSGISLFCSNNSAVSDNIIINNQFGIYANFSYGNAIQENTVRGNGVGMDIVLSGGNDISGNTIFHNGLGLNLANYPPYPLYQFPNHIVSRNRIENNTSDGIHARMTVNGSFIENDIIGNGCGMNLFFNFGMTSYHNNLINNTVQVRTQMGADNVWDNDSEGNYWSNGVHSDSNGDGISEISYTIDADNADLYPLMSPYWYWTNPITGDLNRDMKVDVKDLAICAKAYGSYPGAPNWNPNADITGSQPLVPDGQVDIRDIALTAKNYGKTYY